MIEPRPSPSRPARLPVPGLVLAVLLLGGIGRPTQAQSISVDPYDPWNAMYRPFVYPITPVNPAVPNASRMDALGTGRRLYDNPIDDLSGDGLFERSGPSSRFQPYYRARAYQPYRHPDRAASDVESDRTYIPNRGDTFYEGQQDRERRFFEALRQRDPRRRAAMLREIDQERRAAGRPSTTPRGRAAAEPDVPERSPAARGRAAGSEFPGRSPVPGRPASGRPATGANPGTLDRSASGLGLLRSPAEPPAARSRRNPASRTPLDSGRLDALPPSIRESSGLDSVPLPDSPDSGGLGLPPR